MERTVVNLPSTWLTEQLFEDVISRWDYHGLLENGRTVIFDFPPASKLLARVGLRFLSFLNQLATASTGRVVLRFRSQDGLFRYLDRNGFLNLLSTDIETIPERPFLSGAIAYRGESSNLVEICELHPRSTGRLRQDIVKTLALTLLKQYPHKPETKRLSNAVFTALAELIDNVYSHSETSIPGYATLQVYERAYRVQVAVSDSGIGIPESLRRSLGPRVKRKDDVKLILEAFQQGLSRHGIESGHGCGLPRCAALAAEFHSDLLVRSPGAEVILKTHGIKEGVHVADVQHPRGLLGGTHICLDFRLDSRKQPRRYA